MTDAEEVKAVAMLVRRLAGVGGIRVEWLDEIPPVGSMLYTHPAQSPAKTVAVKPLEWEALDPNLAHYGATTAFGVQYRVYPTNVYRSPPWHLVVSGGIVTEENKFETEAGAKAHAQA